MTEVHILADDKTLCVFIRQDSSSGGFRFTNDVDSPNVIEEAVVDAARVPCINTVGSAERSIAHERVSSAVIVVGSVVRSVVVLLFECMVVSANTY